MAIIYSFPEGTPTLSDTVLGTQFDNNGNPTKSFSISDIIALVPSTAGFVPYTGATQSVDLGAFDLTATSIIKVGGTSAQYLMADGSISTAPSLTGFVPYVGATQNVNLGSFNLTATSIVKAGGTNLQFLMADGSVTTGGGGVTSVTGTSPIISSGGTTPAISIPLGTSSVDGYLSATDRTNFQTAYTNRITSLTTTGTGAATLVANVLNIPTPALSGFVPYTGATGAVNLGAFNLTVNNISVGKGAGTGAAGTAVGNLALSSATTGYNNTAFGSGALKSVTTGYVNTAIGYNTLTLGTSINSCVAIGWSAGENHAASTGTVTFIGAYAGRTNTTGYNNTYIGTGAGQLGTTGTYNTALGDAALQQTTTAGSNTALGGRALQGNTLGSQNIAIGAFAGNTAASGGTNISGNQNVFIGANTNSATQTDTNQIVIGFNSIGAGSNTATLGNTSITTTRLRGAVQGGSFVKDGGTAAQYLMADGSVTTGAPYKYNFSGSVNLTGTLVTTNLLTIIIPANSLSDYLDLRSLMVQQSGPALAGFQIRVWHNSINDFPSATRIANFAFGAGGADLFAQMTRKFSIQSGTLFGFPWAPSNATGDGSNPNAALSIAFNTAVVNYLFVSVQLNNVTDTAILRNVNITT